MAPVFSKSVPKICYGPEVMNYPTFCGINDWGEVVFEDDNVSPKVTDYCEYDCTPHTVHTHTHIEFDIHNPWQSLPGPSPNDGRETGGDE